MLKKTNFLFIIASLTFYIVSCNKVETVDSKTESPQASATPPTVGTSPNTTTPPTVGTSPNTTTPGIGLNASDLTDIDKLLLQVNQANQADKDLAANLLEEGKKFMEQDRQEGLHGGRSGLSKSFCGSAVSYPTIDSLIGCAEATSLEQGDFEAKLRGFKTSSELYQTALLFSERTNTPLPTAERSKVEENIACLDTFTKAPEPETPSCELVRVSLLDPQLPGGKILPSSTEGQ
jgi:hypothetical protein